MSIALGKHLMKPPRGCGDAPLSAFYFRRCGWRPACTHCNKRGAIRTHSNPCTRPQSPLAPFATATASVNWPVVRMITFNFLIMSSGGPIRL